MRPEPDDKACSVSTSLTLPASVNMSGNFHMTLPITTLSSLYVSQNIPIDVEWKWGCSAYCQFYSNKYAVPAIVSERGE